MMSTEERRAQKRERRRREIMKAAWEIADEAGWAALKVEKIAERAKLGRATMHAFFESSEELAAAMADSALEMLRDSLSTGVDLAAALDAPLGFSRKHPAAFDLLFNLIVKRPEALAGANVKHAQESANRMLGTSLRLTARSETAFPADATVAAPFLVAISIAGATVPMLRDQTLLRHQWHEFCLKRDRSGSSDPPGRLKYTPTAPSDSGAHAATSRRSTMGP